MVPLAALSARLRKHRRAMLVLLVRSQGWRDAGGRILDAAASEPQLLVGALVAFLVLSRRRGRRRCGGTLMDDPQGCSRARKHWPALCFLLLRLEPSLSIRVGA